MKIHRLKASTTIEMAYIMPLIFLVFISTVYMLFYLHDKNIIKGTAFEAAIICARQERLEEGSGQGEKYFTERIQGKLIFFAGSDAEIVKDKKEIIVRASASGKGMNIIIEERAAVTSPEEYIRDVRRVEKGIQGVKE